jgi:hypothetical protein
VTETRQQTPPQQSSQASLEEEIAAAIALILSGAVVPSRPPVEVIAGLLLLIPGLPDEARESSVTERVARLVVREGITPNEGTGSVRRAYQDNLAHAAHYAVNATKRVGMRLADGDGLKAAFEGEARPFAQHLDANRRRLAGARMVEAAAELHGPLLGWRHGHPKEPRPAHKAADGANFRVGSVPASTGALPGVLPGCTCTVVSPHENGRILS